MSLTNLLGNKIRALVAGVVLTACGDTNNYYVNGGSRGESSINSCEGVMDKYFACGLNEPDSDYTKLVNKCKNKGWLNSEWKTCFEANSCKDLAAGICEPYANG